MFFSNFLSLFNYSPFTLKIENNEVSLINNFSYPITGINLISSDNESKIYKSYELNSEVKENKDYNNFLAQSASIKDCVNIILKIFSLYENQLIEIKSEINKKNKIKKILEENIKYIQIKINLLLRLRNIFPWIFIKDQIDHKLINYYNQKIQNEILLYNHKIIETVAKPFFIIKKTLIEKLKTFSDENSYENLINKLKTEIKKITNNDVFINKIGEIYTIEEYKKLIKEICSIIFKKPIFIKNFEIEKFKIEINYLSLNDFVEKNYCSNYFEYKNNKIKEKFNEEIIKILIYLIIISIFIIKIIKQ